MHFAVSQGPGYFGINHYWVAKLPEGGYETTEHPRFSELKRLIEEIEPEALYHFSIKNDTELWVEMKSPEEYVGMFFFFIIDTSTSTLKFSRNGEKSEHEYSTLSELISYIKKLWNGPMQLLPAPAVSRVDAFPVDDEEMGGCVETLQLLHARLRLLEKKHFHL